MKAAENKTLTVMYREAREATNGPHSLAHLADAGHPYAVRDPQTGEYPPEILNEQSGKFKRSWRKGRAVVYGRRIIIRLTNTDPKKRLMEGTPLMVRRAVGPYVLRITRAVRRKNYRAALRKVKLRR